MTQHLKDYGNATGPLGFPMQDEEARELDKLLSEHSKDSAVEYKQVEIPSALKYFIDNDDEKRVDVSCITDDSIDLDREIVAPKGIDWSHFDKRRTVTFNHDYGIPPMGKALWWKMFKDNKWHAKTQYIERPDNHPEQAEWFPDTIFHYVKERYMPGKSIGFLPLEWHQPSKEELSKNYNLKNVDLIWDKTVVYEYAVCPVQCNTNAMAEEVSLKGKSLSPELSHHIPDIDSLIHELREKQAKEKQRTKEPEIPKGIKGLRLQDYEKGIERKVKNYMDDLVSKVPEIAQNAIDTMKGKV